MGARDTREFDGVCVDTGDWPIIVIDFRPGKLEDAALQSVLDRLEELMRDAERTRERVFVVNDLTRMRLIPSASQRKVAGEWVKRTAALSKAVSVGAAQVTPSAILRGIITAVFWFHPSPSPSVFVATRQEALSCGIGMLAKAGVPLPSRLQKLRPAPNVGQA